MSKERSLLDDESLDASLRCASDAMLRIAASLDSSEQTGRRRSSGEGAQRRGKMAYEPLETLWPLRGARRCGDKGVLG